ncbi:hypothetical protein [Mangrovihabitans endophyticus]|uniref:Holin n=1 Tax=Mangrovihabitans endophyticus TaxID=1751298 RepID=A0A8J3BXQ7_9ACTN|nr:hypothetical protein [Mangrovihabitans endophyticus]GGK89039.1 hypothetical protein GCM10012284_23860 [Mangrovihabitans endophyticus]
MFARIRKAVAAGVSAGALAAAGLIGGVLKGGGQVDQATISQAVGALIVGGIVAGYAAWRLPNAASPADVDEAERAAKDALAREWPGMVGDAALEQMAIVAARAAAGRDRTGTTTNP